MTAYQERTNQFFKDHNLIIVSYEDLASNTRDGIDSMYSRLGLKSYRKESQLKKQNPECIPELVLNYRELKKEFKGSRWETFFE